MSYIRVRSKSSKRNREKRVAVNDTQTDCCPIPSSLLKTFIEENPNADESAQIEAFLGQSMIYEFNENIPNLINTCPEEMADYRVQRELIDKIKAIKREKRRHSSSYESSGVSFGYSSEPFFTVLIKVESYRKPTKDDILDNLQHLGTIEDIVLYTEGYDYQFAFVRFESSDVAFDLIQSFNQIKFSYEGVRNVSIRAFPKRRLCSSGGYELMALMRSIDKQVLLEKVRKSLKNGQHFYEMEEYILLTETDRQNRLNLCHKLESVLNNNQIGCKFHVFGSTVNELGFCDSDIDVFIEISEQNNITNKMDSNVAIEYLIRVREVLGRELRMYIRPTIQSRRCPLVKLDFRQFGDSLRENGISLDLSLVNSLGIHNSKLIAFYCKLEPHFQTLAVVLRYLAKINGFIGSSQMSSYAFSMLIIFFCQSLPEPLLPTVDDLMKMKIKSVVMNGIECGFCDDVDHYRHVTENPFECNDSVNSLLELFFEFYTRVDFRGYVICPRSGIFVPKTKFNKYLGSLGVTNVDDFQMTELICIQDPFDLTFNMTHHMPYKLFLELLSWFKKVSANRHQYFSQELSDDQNIITFMDLLEPLNQPIDAINKQMEKVVKTNDNILKEKNDIQVIGEYSSEHFIAKLTTNFESNESEDIETQLEDWSLKVTQFFRLLFRQGFKMNCFYNFKPKSKIKLNQKTTIETFLLTFKTFDRRIVDKNIREITENELKVMKGLPLDFIKRQTAITEVIDKSAEDCLIIADNSDEIQIELELSLERNNDISLNVIRVLPQNGSKLIQRLIDIICETFRSGLEAEQLNTIDDDISIVFT